MASWAKPGVKCVCVDASPCAWTKRDTGLVGGVVYTVRAVPPVDQYGEDGVFLVELASYSERWGGGKFGFRISRFRPLVTKTQEEDVAMFKRIADDVPLHEMIEAGLYPIT